MDGVERIAAERRRQIEKEGWTPEHDNAHSMGELTSAAMAYAAANLNGGEEGAAAAFGSFFPRGWDAVWWKPSTDPIRNLEKAGALLAAEIDRLQRKRALKPQAEPLTAGEEPALANFQIALKDPVEFECEYRNWRGEVATRRLRAIGLWHGSTKWHPMPGLMLKAVDLDKNAERDFALADFNMTTLRIIAHGFDAESDKPTAASSAANRAETSDQPSSQAALAGVLTREAARQTYGESGLADLPLTLERMIALRDAINTEMLAAALMDGTCHMDHPSRIRIHGKRCAELRCSSHYFEGREAVTFNQDGFVGFAGWADDTNVQPILRGFLKWVEHEAEVAELN